MKQHERTHKGGHGNNNATVPAQSSRGASSGASGSASPAANTKQTSAARSRRESVGTDTLSQHDVDVMDVDAIGAVGSSPTMMAGQGLGAMAGNMGKERPKMRRSELSEILENVNSSGGFVSAIPGAEELMPVTTATADGGMDEEGESPGLDALAMAAGAVV